MPMTVEAAVVTQKSAALDFNTDSVNAAGKLWPREIVHGEKGIRAVGVCRHKPYYVLASSATKGTAESAADLFKNCEDKFDPEGTNCALLTADFFKAFARVLTDAGFESSSCAFSVFAGFHTTAYLAKSASNRIFTYYDDTFTEIEPEMTEYADGKASYGVAQCNNVKAGDVFLLLTESVTTALTVDVIAAICRSAQGDIKKIAALIASQSVKFGCEDAVSAVIIKIQEATAAAAAANEAVPAAQAVNVVVNTAKSAAGAESLVKTEKKAPAEKSESTGPKRTVFLIIALIAILLVIGIVYMVVSALKNKNNTVVPPGNTQSSLISTEENAANVVSDETSQTTSEPESESVSVSETESVSVSETQSTTEPTTQEPSTRNSYTPVTQPPATDPPVTQPPVTQPPVTQPPVTQPPVTEPPVTQPPVTEPPATEPPATEPPATEPPATEPPAPPVTQAPETPDEGTD